MKQGSRPGNPTLPVGQTYRGFPGATSMLNKDKSAFESIGQPGNPLDADIPGAHPDPCVADTVGNAVTVGYRAADSAPNSSKDGDTVLPDDNRINRGYTYQGDGDPGLAVTNPGAVRQFFGVTTPTVVQSGSGNQFDVGGNPAQQGQGPQGPGNE